MLENAFAKRLRESICFLTIVCVIPICRAAAQDTDSLFSRLRELPDLGACPSNGTAPDADLRKALSSAVAQMRSRVTDTLDLLTQMRDTGLASPAALKQLSDSADKVTAALKDPDPCISARAFVQLRSSGDALRTAVDDGGMVRDNSEPARHDEIQSTSFSLAPRSQAMNHSSSDTQTEVVDSIDSDSGSNSTPSNSAAPAPDVSRDKISISTDVLDFGHQSMQTSSDPKPVTVTNGSGRTLSLRVVSSTGQSRNFQISGCQNAIDDGKQCTFNVTFTPYPEKKMRERFLAVVPSRDVDRFERLRGDLTEKEMRAERAEEAWRVTARCADQDLLGRDSDCPSRLGLPPKANAEDAYEHPDAEQDAGGSNGVCSRDPHESDPITPNEVSQYRKDKHFASMVTTLAKQIAKKRFACYASWRSRAAQSEETIRSQFNLVTLRAVADHWRFPFTRAVVGTDMSAPTSNTLKQAYFVDFNLIAPLKLPGMAKNEDPLENRLWVWLNPRLTSLPQATNFSAVSTINETGSFFDSINKGKLNDIANGLDVSGGIEFALVKPRDGIPWWGEYVNTQARLSPSLIAGVGASTPFSTNSSEVQSTVTQAICDAFKAPTGQTVSDQNGLVCGILDSKPAIKVTPNPDIPGDNGLRSFVDFFTPDRSRFFRRYYAGFRFKTYFFNRDVHSFCKPFESRSNDEGDCAAPYDIFPGIIDLTVGRDEAVTAGHLSGWLFRMEAVYPLPWYQGIHIFGSVYTKLARNRPDQPFTPYTIQKPQDGAATDLNTFRFGLHPLDRDYFRIGVGVDLIQVFKKAAQPSKNAPQAPPNGN